jgi:tetratricopeptide (TPR) repeat protein
MTAPLLPDALPVLTQLGILPKYLCRMPPGHRRTQCRALINWLTRYQPSESSDNLTQVKGYLQAARHLCDIQEWERAFTLLSTRLNTPTREMLHYQLKLWGYSSVRTELYKTLLARLDSGKKDGWSARILQFVGESLYSQGQYAEAEVYYNRSLALFKEVGDDTDVGLLLSALGDVYYAQGHYDKAIEHQQECLKVTKAAGLLFA